MPDTLTALDGTFLRLEELDEGALMSLGGVMVFDPLAGGVAPTIEAVRAHLATRLGELPRYTQRLSSARTTSFAWPHWVPDEQFDIRHHVGRAELPAPGDDAQLRDWTAEFFSRPLDRTRPLWEMVLIEGLENGQWALGWKTHHCLVDGVVAVDLIGLLLGPGPTAGTEPTPHEARVARTIVAVTRSRRRCSGRRRRRCAWAARRFTLRRIPGRRWSTRAGLPN